MTTIQRFGAYTSAICRGSPTRRRAPSARRTSPARRARAGMATEGTGAGCARDLGQGWKISPSVGIEAGRDVHAGRHRRPRRDPADLDDADRQLALQHPAHLLGRSGAAVGRVPGGRFLRDGLGRVRAALVAGGLRQPRQRLQLLLGDALPQALPHHDDEHRRRGHDALLPDQLHADRCARGRGLLPRPVPPRQSAALQGRLHHPRRRQGPGPLRGHLHGLGRQQHRLVGRGRDQVLHGRRRRVPHDLRHRHRGLLLRLVQLREPARRTSTRSSPRPTPGCTR